MAVPEKHWSFSLRTKFLFFVAIGTGSCAATKVYRFKERIASEYNTARVIRDVTAFVSANNGNWPQSWDDLPNGALHRQYVRMQFDVDTADLVEDPDLIHTVITPVSGEYHTYPHAYGDLEELRKVLREVLGQQRRAAKQRAAAKKWVAP